PSGGEHGVGVRPGRQQRRRCATTGWVRDSPSLGRAPHPVPDLARHRSRARPGTAILAPRTSIARGDARRVRGSRQRGSGARVSVAVAPAVVVERTVPMAGAVELVLYHPPSAAAVGPGQFFQLAVSAPHTILRRPYSAAWSDPSRGNIGFIFNVVGAGSAWLSARGEGDALDLLGPLGRGFELEGKRPAVCIAGGLGVAVFPGVEQALVARGRKVTMLQGARTASQLLPAERFPGADVRMATDDGSAGH